MPSEPLTFERKLVSALDSTAAYAEAFAIYHLFQSGLFELLKEPRSVAQVATELDFDPDRLSAFLLYLLNDGLLNHVKGGYQLSAAGRALEDFRPWFVMFVGGYAQTFSALGAALKAGAPFASRHTEAVAEGSGGIGVFDSIPLTKRLLQKAGLKQVIMLDLGCGSAESLIRLCKEIPAAMGFGVEEDLGAFETALAKIKACGLSNRVTLFNCSTEDMLRFPNRIPANATPNVAVFGFVLHELLAAGGEAQVSMVLTQLANSFPGIYIIVIDVDWQADNPIKMAHPLAKRYYNPYFLLHGFTRQTLRPRSYWVDLFKRLGFSIYEETTDPSVDSTGFELGFLLHQ